jgi:hypothetical protein
VFAYIAQRCGAEQSVGEGVESYIGITVAEQTAVVGYVNTAHNALATFNKAVHIKSVSYTHGESCFLAFLFAEEVAQTVHVK